MRALEALVGSMLLHAVLALSLLRSDAAQRHAEQVLPFSLALVPSSGSSGGEPRSAPNPSSGTPLRFRTHPRRMRSRLARPDAPVAVTEGNGESRTLGASTAPSGSPSLAAPPSPLGDYRHMKVRYPPDAPFTAFSREAWIQLDIDDQGRVSNAVVVRSSGRELDQLALQMVMGFRFKPALDDGGRPISARIIWRIFFEPSSSEAPSRW